MIKVGVILSGCGVQDGSEIYEAVLTLLALEKAGARVVALAPDVEQAEVINHYTGAETRMEGRDVLSEAARITRGKIQATHEISAHDLDALILVGGYGATKNLCTYANDRARGNVNDEVAQLIVGMHELEKPIGAMCIASVVVAMALRGHREAATPVLTIGSDDRVAADLEAMGVKHQNTKVDQICFDPKNRLVSTPAFMLGETVGQVEPGINKLVDQVVSMAREMSATYGGNR